ncbi:MAG TPA: hypothetical protein VEW03_05560 [Longimicrobiaceae bacterium]|nr:hypothetical protein [Longimicrobiaceae bacterium]
MAIPCPGQDTYNQIFGVGRNGPNPFVALISALLQLLVEIASSSSLRDFLNQDCASPCEKVVTGPTFSNFIVRLSPRAGGGWVCTAGVVVDATIECVRIIPTSTDECMKEIASHLHR